MLRHWGIDPVQTLALRNPDAGPMSAYLIRFQSAQFDATAFQRHAIDLPVEIERSVRIRQAEFFCGRLAARHALDALGLATCQVGIGMQREPLWPDAVAGSITHNRQHACAVAVRAPDGVAIGIDIETIATADALAAIRQTALCAQELNLLSQVGAAMPMAALISLSFSAKESFFKAAFGEVRQYFDFDAVMIVDFDPNARAITLRVRRGLSARLQAGATRHAYYDVLDDETICTNCRWEYW